MSMFRSRQVADDERAALREARNAMVRHLLKTAVARVDAAIGDVRTGRVSAVDALLEVRHTLTQELP